MKTDTTELRSSVVFVGAIELVVYNLNMSQEFIETPTSEEEVRPEVLAFKEEVGKADGTLIPLRKTIADGKRLYIASRHLTNPWEYFEVDMSLGYYDIDRKLKEDSDKNANPNFYGWEEDSFREGTPHMSGVMLVDTYVENDGKIVPFGHMDWWINGNYANGGGNMHGAPIPTKEHEELAEKQWGRNDYTAFKVDYSHHGQGVGSLMLATSAIALANNGITRFYTGGLLEPAIRTYARFDIKPSDFNGEGEERSLPIEKLTQHPQVNRIIGDFV